MQQKYIDWKDIAATYYDKCLSLTILLAMFTFMVFPEVKTTTIRSTEKVLETIEILPEIQEKIKPPEEVAKPIVNIEIVDDTGDDSDDEIEVITTIEITTLDPLTDIAPPPTTGQTPRFVVYEDAPVITKRVPPVYPEFARKSKIQGSVVLDIEILSDGSIGAIEVFKSLMPGPGGFDEAAITAVRQWKFQPAKSGGKPVGCWIKQSIVFELSN